MPPPLKHPLKIGIQTWGSEGDIRPLIALAEALVERGHQVELVATRLGVVELPTARPGLTVALVPPGPPADLAAFTARLGDQSSSWGLLKALFRELFIPFLPEMEAAAARLVTGSDLLIGHFAVHPLQAAARAAGKPYISITYMPGLIPTAEAPPHPLPDLGRWFNPWLWRLAGWKLDGELLATCRASFTRAGLQLTHILPDAWSSPTLNLVAASPAFWPAPRDWPAQHRLTGEFISARAPVPLPDALEAFLTAGPPPVYLGLGSPQQCRPEEATALLAEAAALCGRRAIVRSLAAAHPPWTTTGDILWCGAVDHRALFPRCAAVVHHGGAGTSHAAARAGVPSVAVTFLDEQGAWAAALRRAGVAPAHVHYRRVTPALLARRIAEALSPERVANARRLAQAMAAENGIATACALIEAHAVA